MALSDKKNRGEWSELYALVQILAKGKIQSEKWDTNNEDSFFPVIAVTRLIDGRQHSFRMANLNIEVLNTSDQSVAKSVSRSELSRQAETLLAKIQGGKGRSFSIPETAALMRTLGLKKFMGNGTKADLTITIYDPRVKRETEQGFSIKSFMGGRPTLLNASGATNIEYQVLRDLTKVETEELNKLGPIEIVSSLYKMKFQLVLSKIDARFVENLKMIDSQMDLLLAHIVIASFQGKGRDMNDILKILVNTNPLNFNPSNSEIRYSHKMRDLLEAVALGMRPSVPWAGNAEAKGGHLIVASTGEVICQHALDKETLRNYLFENLAIDTPSRKRYKFGKISNGKLTLNFQIRFK